MSPHAMTSLVSDLVEMAKAVERLPIIENELERANDQVEAYAKQAQRLEIKLIDRNAEIEILNARIRDLEVSRDDAELRFLEADDKINRLINLVRGATVTLGEAVKEPEMPQPEIDRSQELYDIATNPNTTVNERIHANNELATIQGEDADSRSGQSEHPLQSLGEQSTGHTQSSFETRSMESSTFPEHGEGQSVQGQNERPSPAVPF